VCFLAKVGLLLRLPVWNTPPQGLAARSALALGDETPISTHRRPSAREIAPKGRADGKTACYRRNSRTAESQVSPPQRADGKSRPLSLRRQGDLGCVATSVPARLTPALKAMRNV